MNRDAAAPPGPFLLFCPSIGGGFPRHSHFQARELASRGVMVEMLCRPDFPMTAPPGSYRQVPCLVGVNGPGLARKLLRVACFVVNYWILAWQILRRRPRFVLMESNTEYFAACWAWPHLLLAALGRTTYLANFHDPAREKRFGPDWWHRLTLRLGFGMLRGGLVHGGVPAGADIPARVSIRSVPHGLLGDAATSRPAFDLRERLGIAPGRVILLSFGLIADRKNLDLLIAALPDLPEVELVIAGDDVSASQRPSHWYKACAEALGVADRVHFVIRYIPEEETPAWFGGADIIALTYNRAFVSQSGVLQLAVLWDKPVLASSGPGPLQEAVETGLGVFVAPDSVPAIVAGLRQLTGGWRPDPAAFAAYRRHASWEANVDGLLDLARSLDRAA
ncbi:glycosyltransferase [Novosphingobium flavum]|uniref:Glycosyltransferase n=1 Tax=Novosphingobium flavum TaxID=1778672 RepID=A0A7X1FPA3_9SPHN|nr:glycosyltransferase [Novosphingobium flavum]MBC2664443.1 glycosyltransferase [Novosphingobium flavum]